jgi:hypothetical protein
MSEVARGETLSQDGTSHHEIYLGHNSVLLHSFFNLDVESSIFRHQSLLSPIMAADGIIPPMLPILIFSSRN